MKVIYCHQNFHALILRLIFLMNHSLNSDIIEFKSWKLRKKYWRTTKRVRQIFQFLPYKNDNLLINLDYRLISYIYVSILYKNSIFFHLSRECINDLVIFYKFRMHLTTSNYKILKYAFRHNIWKEFFVHSFGHVISWIANSLLFHFA